jgi:acyl carrier protein
VARLARAGERTASGDRIVRPDGTVLITGGLGALGLHVARWLVEEHEVQHLVLLGRSEPTGRRLQAVEELRASGAQVTVATADIADADQLEAVLAAIPPELPLRGVLHAAAVLDDGVVAEQDRYRIARVLEPKVAGAWNLHRLTAGHDLDLFVLFSSAAGLLGNAGQAGYAAANVVLDALACLRRASGLPAISIAWGPWAGGGLAAEMSAAGRARMARIGYGTIEAGQGLALLGESLRRDEAVLGALPLDLRALRKALAGDAAGLPSRVLERVVGRRPGRGGGRSAPGGLMDRLRALEPDARRAEMVEAVQGELARVLGATGSARIATDSPLTELGLDSLTSVELRDRLATLTGLRLPATLAFDHPSVDELVAFLLRRLDPGEAARPETGAVPETGGAPVRSSDEVLAMSEDEVEEELLRVLSDVSAP